MKRFQKIIDDCEYLRNLADNAENEDDIELILSQIKHKDLMLKFYEGDYDFTDGELLTLSESFRFLQCTRFNELFILMKHHHQNYFRERLDKNLINDYNSIRIQGNLFMSFVYYNCVEPLKWLICNNFVFNLDYAVELAIERDNLEVLKYLVSIGGNIHKFDYLQIIIYYGYLDLLFYFIEQKIDIHVHNFSLKSASFYGYYEIVKLLLKNGADVNVEDGDSLVVASNYGYYDIVKLLLENGADIHAQDDWSLIRASKNGHYEVVKLLIENGANINAQDDLALIRASEEDHYEIVKLLLGNGANVHARHDDALRYASKYGHYEVVELLQSYM